MASHNSNNSLRVLFVHPDLGIGGAERLVVDAALALQEAGHAVSFVTAHCDRSHAFEEIREGRVPVTVWGDWLPVKVGGKLHLLCSIVRMLWVAFWVYWGALDKPDVIFCDQVSYCVPVLRWTGAKVLFYIHFPDKLLAKQGSALKSCYRYPLDRLEELTTRQADLLVANSKFTAGIVREHFPSIERAPLILNPTTFMRKPAQHPGRAAVDRLIGHGPNADGKPFFVSINRFEKKKNVALAAEAFALLSEAQKSEMHLILAGGFDPLVEENARVWKELEELVAARNLSSSVTLVKNVDNQLKLELICNAKALIYTPHNEHFGIVPVEAMAMGCPVIASNSGGPRETIVDGETGYLCDDTAEAFSQAMDKLSRNPHLSERMGRAGEMRVKLEFGPEAFGRKLGDMIDALMGKKTRNK